MEEEVTDQLQVEGVGALDLRLASKIAKIMNATTTFFKFIAERNLLLRANQFCFEFRVHAEFGKFSFLSPSLLCFSSFALN